MARTAAEQYLLELINRARLDPAAEARRYALDLNAGLPAGTIGTQTLQVLAPDARLEEAARGHSAWMLETDSFSHTGQDGSNAQERIEAEGYAFEGSWSWRENLAWRGASGGDIDLGAAIEAHHEGLYRSALHRENTFTERLREVGIAQVAGQFTHDGTDYDASMVTANFARSGDAVFVTGAAFRDADGDLFYGLGEGTGGVRIEADGAAATTQAAGGYGIAVGAGAETDVRVFVDGDTLAELALDTRDGNVKLDVVETAQGGHTLLLSGSARLGAHRLEEVHLLGQADLSLAGGAGRDALFGNGGDNALSGGAGSDRLAGQGGGDTLTGDAGRDRLSGDVGDDRILGGAGDDLLYGGGGADALYGGAGADLLIGGAGSDRLEGGTGDDLLMGGAGADSFIYDEGRDRIADHQAGVDRIYLDPALVGSVEEALDLARVRDGDAVFDFGGGDVLIVESLSDVSVLADDLAFG